MSTAVMVKIEARCRIPIWRTFGRIPWHVIPEQRITLQGAATWMLPNKVMKKLVYIRNRKRTESGWNVWEFLSEIEEDGADGYDAEVPDED